ncbi:hypothetical protein RFI_10437 [Reticulomyxa filosa]|uniref:Uncharacterized protein n=1 Tax=Reticulomyxa filosa TaxID=46433 RepID=X6NL25_RETFI|nr:hypothetical protein RFI_10437 [Reticulomyxa filosa]|eukprot:ETO26701.1 hypothetical protein RFI_10437 [Reticulomyxa filosa]
MYCKDNVEPLKMSLIGQGLCVLAGHLDEFYGVMLRLYLYRIVENTQCTLNKLQSSQEDWHEHPLQLYHTIEIPMSEYEKIKVRSLASLNLDTMWSYCNDLESDWSGAADTFESSFDDESNSNSNSSDEEEEEAYFKDMITQLKKAETLLDQQWLIVPVAVLWSGEGHDDDTTEANSAFIVTTPLVKLENHLSPDDNKDEVWKRIRQDYMFLYGGQDPTSESSPDHSLVSRHLVTVMDLSRLLKISSADGSSVLPNTFSWEGYLATYGGGIVHVPYDIRKLDQCITLQQFQQRQRYAQPQPQTQAKTETQTQLLDEQSIFEQTAPQEDTDSLHSQSVSVPYKHQMIKQLSGSNFSCSYFFFFF